MTRTATEVTYLTKARDLKNDYYAFTFGPYSKARHFKPGQFIHACLPGTEVYFRRAFSVAAIDPDNDAIELIFKVFGRGTRLMGKMRKGDAIDFLGPLGNTFALPGKSERVIMVAGGVGFPPLMFFAEYLVNKGYDPKKIEFFYGGASKPDIIERARIKRMGVNFRPVTEDGSLGEPGLVTIPVEQFIQDHRADKLRVYGCGPEGMLKATSDLALKYTVAGQLSLEAPMPCGIGICMGCVVPLTDGGHARVCREGPVFDIGRVKL